MTGRAQAAGVAIVGTWIAAAVLAPVLVPNDASATFRDHVLAPPTRVRVVHDGRLGLPFFHPQRLVNPLLRTYVEDRSRIVPIRFLAGGRLFASADPAEPFLPLGADASGRDVFARIVTGARVSLGIALTAACGAAAVGVFLGAIAGAAGGRTDVLVMRLADFAIVLPAMYVLLALRAALPLVLSPVVTALATVVIFVAVGWPHVARGARNLVAAERTLDYVSAARALGASRARILVRHLIPACAGFVRTQVILLVPAFVVAEATLSFVGLGFSDAVATWGTQLQDAANVAMLAQAPWVLAPSGAIVSLVLGLNLLAPSVRDPFTLAAPAEPRQDPA